MQPPPLQRRKSFWFGALVLVFIGWASWQSFGAYRVFGWDTGSHAVGFVRMNGSTYFVEGPLGTPPGLVFEELIHLPPPSMVHHWKREGIGVTRFSDVATVFLFVVIWVGWLAWLERRAKRSDNVEVNP